MKQVPNLGVTLELTGVEPCEGKLGWQQALTAFARLVVTH
jgi:hypothetical protein